MYIKNPVTEESLTALFDRCLHAIARHPYVIICATVLMIVFSMLQLVNLQTGKPILELDPSIDSILPKNDPNRDYFNHVKSLFGSGETVVIGLSADNIFTEANLKKIQIISEKIASQAQVERVSSLSTALNIRSEGSELLIEPFYDNAPQDAESLAALKSRALADPIYAGNLVSLDGKVASITVHLMDIPEKELLAKKVDDQIADIARQEWPQGKVWVAGGAHVKAAMSNAMLHDVTTIVPLAMIMMAVVAGLSFRTIRGVLIPVVTLIIGIVITMAWIAWYYKTLNQVTVAVPALLVVTNFAYGIHMLAAYYDILRARANALEPHAAQDDAEHLVFHVLKDMTLPVVYTGLTTVVGFLSLATSPIVAIQEFGIAAAVGVMITMIVALTLTPAILRLLPIPKQLPKAAKENWMDLRLAQLALFSIRHARGIFIVAAVVCLAALAAIPQIKVSTDLVNGFKKSSSVRQDFHAVNNALQGANAMYIVLKSDSPEAFQEPANLKVMEALQLWLKQQPEVGGSTSLVDYVKVINQGMHEGGGFEIPATKAEVSDLLVIGGNDEMKMFIDFSYQTARMVVRTTATDSADILALSDRIEAYAAKNIPSGLHPHVTGDTYLVAKTMDDIAWGQALGFGTAFILIYLIMVIVLTSFKAGMIAMIPNVIPVLLFFGVLGWFGISLNVTNGLIADIILGIAVDDTIHLMTQFNRGAKQFADEKQGVMFALKSVGRPVLYTTMALCLGFLCMTMSEMQTQVEFGLLATGTLLAAWLIDMTLTPALAGKMKIVTLWDVLHLDLGDAPQKSIPLFLGLTSRQSRVAALMADIREYNVGDKIFTRGDKGEHMYVVIDGSLGVTLYNQDGTVFTKELGRGSTVGEVALYHGERTADVYASSPVRLLEITKSDLESIQQRHPRIAAQLYANLNAVFAGRFANLTAQVQQ